MLVGWTESEQSKIVASVSLNSSYWTELPATLNSALYKSSQILFLYVLWEYLISLLWARAAECLLLSEPISKPQSKCKWWQANRQVPWKTFCQSWWSFYDPLLQQKKICYSNQRFESVVGVEWAWTLSPSSGTQTTLNINTARASWRPGPRAQPRESAPRPRYQTPSVAPSPRIRSRKIIFVSQKKIFFQVSLNIHI